MKLEPGHAEGRVVVHLTHTALMTEALCGEVVTHHGEPDLAVACDECLSLAALLGEDVTAWFRISHDDEPAQFLAAA